MAPQAEVDANAVLKRFEREQRKQQKHYVADMANASLGAFTTLTNTVAPSVYYTAAQVVAPEGGNR